MKMKCGHCGNETTWELHEPYVTDKKYPYGTHEVSEVIVYSTLMCTTCSRPTLLLTRRIYEEVDAQFQRDISETLYPIETTKLSNLPERIERKYNAALKVRYIEPNACAVLVGRTLEAACNHEQAQGRTLAQKLNYLAQNGRIPNTLAEMARQSECLMTSGRL